MTIDAAITDSMRRDGNEGNDIQHRQAESDGVGQGKGGHDKNTTVRKASRNPLTACHPRVTRGPGDLLLGSTVGAAHDLARA